MVLALDKTTRKEESPAVSLFFEDCKPDPPIMSAGRTITETDVVLFAGLSGDFTQLHTNEAFAQSSPFGARVAHGALVLSMSIGLSTRTVPLDTSLLAFVGIDKLRFVKPVFINDTIRIVKRVHERREIDAGRGTVVFHTSVVNQRDETVLVYYDKLLLKRREAASTQSPAAE